MADYYTYLYRDTDNTPIYVGKGHCKRAYAHIHNKGYLGNILRKRKRENQELVPIIHYEVDEDTALEMEKFWIAFYGRKDLGQGTLLNLTDGGEGPSNPSPATRELQRAHRLGKRMSEESTLKKIAATVGQKRTQDQIENYKKSARRGETHPNHGRVYSPEEKQAQSKRMAIWWANRKIKEQV